jgi:uncharacterized protein YkwD
MSIPSPQLVRGIRIAAVVLAALLPLGCVEDNPATAPPPPGTSPPPPAPAPGPTDAQVVAFVDLMNEHRESIGLSALVWDSRVAAVAAAHSQDMEDRDFFSHTNPDGEGPGDRLREADIDLRAWGENIAWGYSTGSAVLGAWLASEGHRENIENGYFTHHGVGKVGNIWTHVFLKPSSTSAGRVPVATSAPAPLRNPDRTP